MRQDTIAAQATAAGKAGIGIIRISGEAAPRVAQQVLGFVPPPRQARFCQFRDGDQVIDEGIALYFPAPHSFTGEDVLELQGHGGSVILDLLLQTVLQHKDIRLAKPGEFSERAFLNGKMDLTQAEAIADLINADSAQAARCAMRSLQGEFSQTITHFREELIALRQFVEAAIDFPEEEIDFISEHDIPERVKQLITAIEHVQQTAKQGQLLQEGAHIVIAGEPNVGKSSLLNRLSGSERAIVTDIAGTTRDILQERIEIDGLPLHIIDTAGLRSTHDPVEQEGVKRAKQAIAKADLLLLVLDITRQRDESINTESIYQSLDLPADLASITVLNKIDLTDKPAGICATHPHHIYLSAHSGKGLRDLKEAIKAKVGFQQQEGIFIARRRHLNALQRALTALTQGLDEMAEHKASELLAENLRAAQQALNEITGEFSSDDLLGEIFSRFCIGK